MTMTPNEDETQTPGTVSSEAGTPQASQDAVGGGDSSIPVDDISLDDTAASLGTGTEPLSPTAVKLPTTSPVAEVPVDDEEIPKDDPSKYTGYVWPQGPNPNVGPVDAVFKPLPEDQRDDPFAIASIPCDADTFNSLMEAYPSINYQVGQLNREWASEISNGARLLNQGSFLKKAANREGSMWYQRVPYGASDLGIIRPRLGQPGGMAAPITGDLASLRVRQELGLGASTNVPLFHSGFWVTLRAPVAAARLELQQRIDQEKIELGRSTAGLAFSNISVYLKSYLVDFALAHLVTSNARYSKPLDLKDKILSTDIPLLIWGVLTTLYPYGYPYHQPCINDPSKCNHVVKDIIDLNKICFTDRQRLSESQLKHMSNRQGRVEDQQLESYRNEHVYAGKGLIFLKPRAGNGKDIKIQLKVPTVSEYSAAGFDWVDGIVNAIQQAFGSDLMGERRNAFILDRAKMLSMGEYSHWVKQIGFNDGTTIEDVDTIRSTLAEISGDSVLSESFFTQVVAYIEEATLSMIALPRFNCPVCGTDTAPDAKHPHLNPIDVEALFFMMLGQHIVKVLS